MKHKKKLIEAALPLDAKRSGLESHCRLLTSTVFTTVAGRASEGPISAWRAERLRVFRSCPLITPKGARSSLQMLTIAQAMPVLCAYIRLLLARCSVTLEFLSASEPYDLVDFLPRAFAPN